MIILQNSEIQLTLRPDLGGRLDSIQDCQTGKEWLWHPANYEANQTRSLKIGESFDAHWTGGWDEIFPNDVAGKFQAFDLVDHGELWSQNWTVLESSKFQVKLAYQCQTVPVRVEKTIQLDQVLPEFKITYTFQNQSDQTIPFLFKQHAAIAIETGDQILLPDCTVEPVTLDFSKLIGRAEKTRFPKALDADGQEIDLQWIPPKFSQLQEFYYCSDLAHGECGIRNRKSNSALVMSFSSEDFPYVWVFQSYGGWQNHYVLVMEPATTMPYDLEIACKNGTAAQLNPQEIQQRQLTVRLQRYS